MASIGRFALAGCLWITLTGAASAQSRSSLTDRDSGDAATAVRLDEQLLLAREAIRSLTESLALANGQAEEARRHAADLQVKFDALAPGSGGGSDLQERLLSAVNELTRQQKDNSLLFERLLSLTESVQIFLKSVETADNEEHEAFAKGLEAKAANPADPAAQSEAKTLLDTLNRSRTAQAEARAALEMEMRAANRLMDMDSGRGAETQAGSSTLTDAAVVEVKPEFALVVADIGRQAGVKVGMPFQVWRGNRRIGDVRVIDTRDRISGAVIQNLVSEKETVKTGDRLRVDARR